MSKNKCNRELAIEWWNSLGEQKGIVADKYHKGCETIQQHEIESIWFKETGGDFSNIPDELICDDYDENGFEEMFDYKISQKACDDYWKDPFKSDKLQPQVTPELVTILRACYKAGVDSVTFPCYSFKEEYLLSPDDRDYVTFYRKNCPYIVAKLHVCDEETTEEPVWKDWFMTINYHS